MLVKRMIYVNKLRSYSYSWNDLDADENPIPVLQSISPHVLIDLGGHTADSRPSLLNTRLAPLQVSYLGFYGPTYGTDCDWWILDELIAQRVQESSYPTSEPIWELPCPSLCFDPLLHGLPEIDDLYYSEPSHPFMVLLIIQGT